MVYGKSMKILQKWMIWGYPYDLGNLHPKSMQISVSQLHILHTVTDSGWYLVVDPDST